MSFGNVVGRGVYELETDNTKFRQGLQEADRSAQETGRSWGRLLETFGSVGNALDGIQIASSFVARGFGAVRGAIFDMNSQLETAQLQFETLLGSADAAEKHVADLFEFAKVTPYETGPIIEASRQLQAFGGTALNNYEMLTLLGDAASAVSAPFEEVAFWTGRAYSAIQSGRPIGEAAARFQELALITPEARNRLEELQEAGASADEVFSVLTENFGRFSGSMEKQANTWQGMVATFTDTVDLLLSTALRPFFELASRGLAQLNAFLDQDSVTQKIEDMADALRTGIEAAISFIGRLIAAVRGPFTSIWVAARDSVLTFVQALQGDWVPDDRITTLHLVIGRLGSGFRTVYTAAQPFISALVNLGRYVQAVRKDGDTLNDWLTHFPEPLRPIIQLVGRIVENFDALVTVFTGLHGTVLGEIIRGFGRGGLQGAMEGALTGVEKYFKALRTVGSLALDVFRTLGGVVLEAIQDIDWGALASEAIELLSQGFSAITSLADDVLDVLTGAFDAIDWSGLGSTILDAITGVDYSGIASTILDAIITGAQAIADFGSRFVGWFIDAVTGVDWQGLASTIIDGIVDGFFAIVDFGTRFVGWLQDTLGGVDWAGIGGDIVDGIMAAVTAIQDVGQRIVDWIRDNIVNADWSAIGQSVRDNVAGAFESIQGLGETSAFERVADVLTDKLGPAFKTIASEVGPRIAPTINALRESFGKMGETLQTRIGPLMDQLQSTLQSLLPLLQAAGTIVGAVLLAAFNALGRFLAGVLPSALDSAITLIETFLVTIENVAEVITAVVDLVMAIFRGDWSAAWEAAGEIVSGTVTVITEFWRGLGSAILSILEGFINGIIGFFQGLYDTLVGNSIVPDLIDAIVNFFASLPGRVIDLVSGFVSSVQGFFSDLLATSITIFSDLVTEIAGKLGEIVTEGATKGAEIVSAILGELAKLLIDAPSVVGGLIGTLGSKLEDVATAALDWGADIVSGLIDGLRSKIGDLGDAAGDIAGTISGKVTGFFGISSPSKLAIQWGEDILAGLRVGLENFTPDVLDAIDRLTGSMNAAFSTLAAAVDVSNTLRGGFVAPSSELMNNIVTFANDLVATTAEIATKWSEEALENVRTYAGAVGSVVSSFSGAVESLKSLQGLALDLETARAVITAVKELTEHMIASIGDTAVALLESRGGGFLELASAAADAMISGIEALADGIEVLPQLSSFSVNMDAARQAITNIKWLLEQIVQDLGDSAQWLSSQRPDGFLGATQLFGTAAVAGTEAMREGLEFIVDLANFKGLVDLGTARQFVTDLKWLIEHVAASIGDTAQFLQASRPEGFFAAIKDFSDAVKPGFDILNGALEFMRTVIKLDENKFVLDGIGEWIGVFARVAELVASDLQKASSTWTSVADPRIAAFVTDVRSGFGAITDALAFMKEVVQLDENTFVLDGIGEWIGVLTRVAELVALEVSDAASTWSKEVNPRLSAFSSDVQTAFGAIGSVLQFIQSAGESAARVSTAGASTLAQQLLNVARTVADAASEASRLWASEANPHLKAFSEDAQASLGIVGSAVTTIRSLMELRDEKDGKPLNAASLVPALIGVVETIVGAVRAAANRFAGEGNESIRSFTESVGGMLDIVARTTDVVNQLAGMRQLSNYSMGVFKKNWESILTLLGEVSQLIKTNGVQVADDILLDVTRMSDSIVEAMRLMNVISAGFLESLGGGNIQLPNVGGVTVGGPNISSVGIQDVNLAVTADIPIYLGNEHLRRYVVDVVNEIVEERYG